MTAAPCTVIGIMTRDAEWGTDERSGDLWAKLDLLTESCNDTAVAGTKPVSVLVGGQNVTAAVKVLRAGDRLRAVGTLTVAQFKTEDGTPGQLLELHAKDVAAA